MNGYKNFSWKNNTTNGICRFFCSDSIKPENHILFALSLTLDMKALARTRMQRVKKDYKKNEKKYEAEGKRLREFSNMKNIQNFITFLK